MQITSTGRFSFVTLSLLPVLLMFLKLPKLFNFHILRLAAEREISTGKKEEKDKVQSVKKNSSQKRK